LSLFGEFGAALGFLTRFGPSERLEPRQLANSLPFFPLIGLMLGLLLSLPFALGFLPGHHWIQALLLTALSLWVTRGLHWDGLADVFDAWGSGRQGEEFFAVIKDSRTGSFGAMALALGLVAEVYLFQALLAAKAYHIVAWAFLLGRGCSAVLAVLCRKMRRPGLGGSFMEHAAPWMLFPLLFQVLAGAAVFCTPSAAVLSLALAGLGLSELFTLAQRNEGINGDFLGAAAIFGEIAALVAWDLTGAELRPGLLYLFPELVPPL
jgi:adenosylcobinamide-GDP ribazoletransferase